MIRAVPRSSGCRAAHVAGVSAYTSGWYWKPYVRRPCAHAWARHPDDLGTARMTLDELKTRTAEHYPSFERLSNRLFESIAMLLVPSDRRYKGLVKDLHH